MIHIHLTRSIIFVACSTLAQQAYVARGRVEHFLLLLFGLQPDFLALDLLLINQLLRLLLFDILQARARLVHLLDDLLPMS